MTTSDPVSAGSIASRFATVGSEQWHLLAQAIAQAIAEARHGLYTIDQLNTVIAKAIELGNEEKAQAVREREEFKMWFEEERLSRQRERAQQAEEIARLNQIVATYCDQTTLKIVDDNMWLRQEVTRLEARLVDLEERT